MSKHGGAAELPGLWMLSDQELGAAIRALEAEQDSIEVQRRVLRRRVAILRAERLARATGAHFDIGAAVEALLRRSGPHPRKVNRRARIRRQPTARDREGVSSESR